MRAAVVEAPGKLVVREVPEPVPGPYEALCRLIYGATCTGTDQHILRGRFPWPVDYPTILGHESVGRVERVGEEVRHLRPGDLITRVGAPPSGGASATWGGFAEWGLARDHRAMREDGLPEREWSPHRINEVVPPDLATADATMMITWRETLSYLERVGVGPGASVLVVGSGGNGLAFAAHAANGGAGRIALVGSAGRERAARAVGATHFADYRGPDPAAATCLGLPGGYDVVIDAVGRRDSLDPFLPCVRDGGAVAVYGVDDWGGVTIRPQRARGSFVWSSRGYDEPEAHDAVVGLMRAGRLRAAPWFEGAGPFALEEIASAFEAVRERRCVKALIRLAPDAAAPGG